MSEAIIVALIGSGSAIVAAVIAARTRKDVRRVRTQVENSHKTNLRDDVTRIASMIDRNHDITLQAFLSQDRRIQRLENIHITSKE